MAEDAAPDGSPVAVYRALPLEPEFTPVLDSLTPPMTVLDLRDSDHVAETGTVLVQHWDTSPDEPADVDASVGEVGIVLRVLERHGSDSHGRRAATLKRRLQTMRVSSMFNHVIGADMYRFRAPP